MSRAPGTVSRPHGLSENASIFLDIVRFGAAIAVVASHSGDPCFGTGWAHEMLWGDLAVPTFFVLSGFVIRYVTVSREGDPREYAIDRVSRIYSVVLPAILVTLLCSGICLLRNRDLFLHDWAVPFNHPATRLLLNLTFLSQIWGHNTVLFINSPFWSLGYECLYYVLYGFIFFLRGWKRLAACILASLVMGPQVLFLLPLWWLGCLMYDIYYRVRGRRASRIALAVLAIWFTACVLARVAGMGRMPFEPASLLYSIANLPNPLELIGAPVRRATTFAYSAGIVGALLLFLSLLAVELIPASKNTTWKQTIRRIADGTFAIYLFHYPIMLLLAYTGCFHKEHFLRNIAVLGGMVCALVVLAGPLDALKRQMRRGLRTAIPERASTLQLPLESN
jgi:peptidoglycan/LPS O-acetylase OafA/YrhL